LTPEGKPGQMAPHLQICKPGIPVPNSVDDPSLTPAKLLLFKDAVPCPGAQPNQTGAGPALSIQHLKQSGFSCPVGSRYHKTVSPEYLHAERLKKDSVPDPDRQVLHGNQF